MEEAPVAREEKGPVSVLTMQYRRYNLLGPTLLGAIADEIAAARDAGSRAIILRSGLRHFSAGAEVTGQRPMTVQQFVSLHRDAF